MTEQQIIEWAREAKAARDGSLFLFYVEDLQCFASLVAAHERERCIEAVKKSELVQFVRYPDGWVVDANRISEIRSQQVEASVKSIED